MHQKRSWLEAFSLLIPLLLLLSACSLDGTTSSSTTSSGKKPADIHVGFVSETQNQNFAEEMAAGAQYAANQFHVTAQIVAPPISNGNQAVQLFNKLTQTAHDGIAVETLAPNLFVGPEARAVKQGIPIIAVDTTPLKGSNITTYVGNDNVAAGAMLANAAIERIPPNATGSILLANPIPGVPVLDYRVQGMKEEFQKLRPKLRAIGPIATGQLPQMNLQAWQQTVTQYSNIVACLGAGDADGVSLAQIKQTSHSTYLSAAFDLNEAALQSVANGTNFALVDPEHFLKGYVAMRLLIEHALQGTAIPQGWWNPGALLVTQTNVQDIITRQTSFDAKAQFYQPIIDKEFANPAAQIAPLSQAK
jgi:ABC-type sugar transport system substrate-binding protein